MAPAATRADAHHPLDDAGMPRRHVLRHAAWAAPAIVLAAAAPAVASSGALGYPVLTGTFSTVTLTGAVMRSGEETTQPITRVYLEVTYVHDRGNAAADVADANGAFGVSDLTQPGHNGIGTFRLNLRLNGGSLTHRNPAVSFELTTRKIRAVTRVVAHGTIDRTEHSAILYEA